jgi:hypothetical protein
LLISFRWNTQAGRIERAGATVRFRETAKGRHEMKRNSRGIGSWLTLGGVVGLLLSSSVAHAKSVSIVVEGASEKWMSSTATRAATSVFRKLGYEVVEPGAPADAVATVSIEKAYSHHGPSPFFFLAGGFIDLWNRDSAHATVTTIVRNGTDEMARQTASASKRDAPFFCWLQRAKRVRSKALGAAVRGSLKQFVTTETPAAAASAARAD